MLKTISAALLAVSVIAAPALAETAGKTTRTPVSKTTQTPANKTVQAPVDKTAQAPVIKADPAKSKLMNANAKMGHHKHYRHHRHHKHMGALKTHTTPKVAVKHTHSVAAKRG
jgi:hypothetical protein